MAGDGDSAGCSLFWEWVHSTGARENGPYGVGTIVVPNDTQWHTFVFNIKPFNRSDVKSVDFYTNSGYFPAGAHALYVDRIELIPDIAPLESFENGFSWWAVGTVSIANQRSVYYDPTHAMRMILTGGGNTWDDIGRTYSPTLDWVPFTGLVMRFKAAATAGAGGADLLGVAA